MIEEKERLKEERDGWERKRKDEGLERLLKEEIFMVTSQFSFTIFC